MPTHVNRFDYVGPDPDGRSAVLQRGLTNVHVPRGVLLARHAMGDPGNPRRQHH